MIRKGLLLGLVLCALVSSCNEQSQSTLDELAEQSIILGLELAEYDAFYIDSYVGPDEWREQAKENLRSIKGLVQATSGLLGAIEAFSPANDDDKLRRKMLVEKVRAMDTRARMANGEKFTFAEEAKLLLDADPVPGDFAVYDQVLIEIDELIPGTGDLEPRVAALRATVEIPEDKLDIVFRAAVEECRQRTLAHMELPESESFRLEYVSGVSWGGYLEYLGDFESQMSINTDSPMTLDGAVGLGCHEGYPGHHVYNLLVDKRYLQELGWVEFQLQPLFAPSMLIHEGSAEYATRLAFPGNESMEFQRDVLAPLAGIDGENIELWSEYMELAGRIGDGGGSTISQRYLDGEISREEAIQAYMKYRIRDRERAERSVRFADEFRSYVLNYGLGEQIVSDYIDGRASTEAERWDEFQKLIRDLPTASDLQGSD